MKTQERRGKSGQVTDEGATSRRAHKDPLSEAVGKRIRQVRESKGYAQEEFAYHAGIDRSYYGAVERGRYSVTAVNLIRIAVALGVEVGLLFPSLEELHSILPEDSTDDRIK